MAEQIGEGKDILLSTIREELFEEYCFYLKKRRLVSATINQHLCWLSRLMYRAVGQGIIRSNPFEDAKYEAVERKLRYLHKGEVDQLLKFPMNDKIAEEARRMFLFSCFTGLSFSDMQALTKANFGITADGEHYIRKERKKTGVESLIPLHPIAKEIALKQANEEESKLFSESYKYHQLKEALKAVGQACGIRQTLTFHMARHTFGTMALSAGVPMESIAKMMGHTTIKSTQIYAQVTDQKISEDMDKLIAKREEGKQ